MSSSFYDAIAYNEKLRRSKLAVETAIDPAFEFKDRIQALRQALSFWEPRSQESDNIIDRCAALIAEDKLRDPKLRDPND